MNIGEFLKRDQVLVGLHADDKAKLLLKVAECAAPVTGIGQRAILTALTERERLGSTGLGSGVAIPHACVDGLKAPFGLFIRLDRSIDFAAVDDKPVDLIFALLTSVNTIRGPLSELACISRTLRDEALAREIRAAHSAGEVYSLLTRTSAEPHAFASRG